MRAHLFNLRLTSEELAAYSASAARDGLSVSAWLRRAAERVLQLEEAQAQEREFADKQARFYDSLKH
jgi:hypothetical protein